GEVSYVWVGAKFIQPDGDAGRLRWISDNNTVPQVLLLNGYLGVSGHCMMMRLDNHGLLNNLFYSPYQASNCPNQYQVLCQTQEATTAASVAVSNVQNTTAAIQPSTTIGCPDGVTYPEQTGSCYKLFLAKFPWSSAESVCLEGGFALARPGDNLNIINELRQKLIDKYG
ncbi:unnamed protein product, partial [Meganyctiphanes norvegica]